MDKTKGKENPQKQVTQWKRLIHYALSFPKHFSQGIGLLLISVGLELVAPLIIKYILDTKIYEQILDIKSIFYWLLLFILVGIGGGLIKFAGVVQLRIVAMRVIQKMRMDLFYKIQGLHISYYDQMPAGKIVSKITNDTAAVENLYVLILSQFLTSFIYLIGVYGALMSMSPTFGGITFLLVPLFYYLLKMYSSKATGYNRVIREKISDINGMINETISGISVIAAYNGQQRMLQEFEEINHQRYGQERKMLLLECALSHNIIGVLRTLTFAIMIYYFGSRVLHHHESATIGMLYVYINYLNTIFQQTNGVFDKVPDMQRSLAASSQIFNLLDMEGEEEIPSKKSEVQGKVEFHQVTFAYKEGKDVLKDINFETKKGQTIGLVGHTGSGKSSIINLLLKLYTPQQGRITVDGQDIQTLPSQDLRKHFGIVLQDPFLFTGTILSNITLDHPHITREKAIEALLMVGGAGILKHGALGIDEVVTERGSMFSAGQRQLISFARALAHDPKILILDEATSSVDSETEQLIQHGMKVLMEGRTTFIVAHRLSTIREADQILVLDDGRMIEKGNHQQLMEQYGKYYGMYMVQASKTLEKEG